MAFLTISDIVTRLPNGYNSDVVVDLLSEIESELAGIGLTFSTFVTEPRRLEPDDFGQGIFNSRFFNAVTSVKIKEYGSSSADTLILNTDYILAECPNVDNLYYRIELLQSQIKKPSYIELAASFGFMVSVPASIKASIIKYILSQLNYQAEGNKHITMSKTGESTTSYNVEKSEYSNSILSYKPFTQTLNKYLIW